MPPYGQKEKKEARRHVKKLGAAIIKATEVGVAGHKRDFKKMGKELKSKAKGSIPYRASKSVGGAVIGSKEGRAVGSSAAFLKKGLATSPLLKRYGGQGPSPKKATRAADRKRSRRTGAR